MCPEIEEEEVNHFKLGENMSLRNFFLSANKAQNSNSLLIALYLLRETRSNDMSVPMNAPHTQIFVSKCHSSPEGIRA